MRQKKIDLHELPYTEIAKPGLASPQVIKSVGVSFFVWVWKLTFLRSAFSFLTKASMSRISRCRSSFS